MHSDWSANSWLVTNLLYIDTMYASATRMATTALYIDWSQAPVRTALIQRATGPFS